MHMGNDNWLKWAMELQALAQAGLAYTKSQYDVERFERIREIAAEMLVEPSGLPLETVKDLFCGEKFYPTPKIACRAAIIEDGKIMMVRETGDGGWCLPGGWVDVDQSVGSNIVKEVREEAGMDVVVERVIAVQDHRKRGHEKYALGIMNVFALCRRTGGEFKPNTETDACGFFSMDDLPPLSLKRTNPEQLQMCFDAYADPNWKVELD